MSIRTVRLDEDGERLLSQILKTTGMSMSATFKEGLKSFHSELHKAKCNTPYAIFKELDLGPGGYAISSSSDTKKAVKEAIRRKLRH